MLTIALSNGKGGTAKTTTTVQVAVALADLGLRVLVVDSDPQGNTSLTFGTDPDDAGKTTASLLLQQALLRDVAIPTSHGPHLVPANDSLLEAMQLLFLQAYNKKGDPPDRRLSLALKEGQGVFDICLIDCPPALAELTRNAIYAADWIIVPFTLDTYSTAGLVKLYHFVRNSEQKELPISLLFSNVDRRCSTINKRVRSQLIELPEFTQLSIEIPRCEKLRQATDLGLPVQHLAPKSTAARAFAQLALEIQSVWEVNQSAAA